MKITSESKENLVPTSSSEDDLKKSTVESEEIEPADYVLSPVEKTFLLTAERGDCAGIRRYVLQKNSSRNQI